MKFYIHTSNLNGGGVIEEIGQFEVSDALEGANLVRDQFKDLQAHQSDSGRKPRLSVWKVSEQEEIEIGSDMYGNITGDALTAFLDCRKFAEVDD